MGDRMPRKPKHRRKKPLPKKKKPKVRASRKKVPSRPHVRSIPKPNPKVVVTAPNSPNATILNPLPHQITQNPAFLQTPPHPYRKRRSKHDKHKMLPPPQPPKKQHHARRSHTRRQILPEEQDSSRSSQKRRPKKSRSRSQKSSKEQQKEGRPKKSRSRSPKSEKKSPKSKKKSPESPSESPKSRPKSPKSKRSPPKSRSRSRSRSFTTRSPTPSSRSSSSQSEESPKLQRRRSRRLHSARGRNRRAVRKAISNALRRQEETLEKRRTRRLTLKLTKEDKAAVTKTRGKKNNRGRQKRKWHKMTLDEFEQELYELLWHLHIIQRIFQGFADIEVKVIRLIFRYDFFTASIVIFCMFWLPLMGLWDYVAIKPFELPYLCLIKYTGVLTVRDNVILKVAKEKKPLYQGISFCCLCANMYAYMMACFKRRHSLSRILGIGILVHVIVFYYRIWLELTFSSFLEERNVNYDGYVKTTDNLKDTIYDTYKGHSDRFIFTGENQPWEQAWKDMAYYYYNKGSK